VGEGKPDELNRGRMRVNVAFTLPPGAYATLVVKRLFHWTLEPGMAKRRAADGGPRARGRASGLAAPAAAPREIAPGTSLPQGDMPVLPPAPAAAPPAPQEPRGFLARKRAEKEARKVRREAAKPGRKNAPRS
jgi:tRNA pseudouridine13 synthase